MGIPATTGQLRTKVSDMEIGDYIAIDTDWAKTMPSSFSNLGNPKLTTEIPVTGLAATGAGITYLIKVAKGLLVSDRVIRNTVSWDGLNGIKLIQGAPWDNGNIIPTMTSNTSPSGVASASSVYSGSNTYPSWKAFDGKTGADDCWASSPDESSSWLQYQFTEGKILNGYAATSRNYANRADLKTWVFEGSNDGIQWSELDKRINERAWAANEKRSYAFANKNSYLYYRIRIIETHKVATVQAFVTISELEMFEETGTIRSLTGGVAYADGNGNKSLTDLGFGGWPTNNEWDKYIVNFPIEKIQAGKTLNDVFHCYGGSSQGIRTWCQETGNYDVDWYNNTNRSDNTHRIARGMSEKNAVRADPSSTSNIFNGFRPVFSYKE